MRMMERCPNNLKVLQMRDCLDLRQLIKPGTPSIAERDSLKQVAQFARGNVGTVADDDVLWAQHLLMRQKLVAASSQPSLRYTSYTQNSNFTSAVQLQADVFTTSSLCEGCQAWLHLHSHMVMKTANESVVESMGSLLDRHSDPHRHLDSISSSQEAFIHWNGPAIQKSRQFLIDSLHERFGGGPCKWHFVAKGMIGRGWLCSEVAVWTNICAA